MARVVFPVGGNGSCAGHDRNFLDFFLSLQDLLVGQVFFLTSLALSDLIKVLHIFIFEDSFTT